jgi:hypothetical protein
LSVAEWGENQHNQPLIATNAPTMGRMSPMTLLLAPRSSGPLYRMFRCIKIGDPEAR